MTDDDEFEFNEIEYLANLPTFQGLTNMVLSSTLEPRTLYTMWHTFLAKSKKNTEQGATMAWKTLRRAMSDLRDKDVPDNGDIEALTSLAVAYLLLTHTELCVTDIPAECADEVNEIMRTSETSGEAIKRARRLRRKKP